MAGRKDDRITIPVLGEWHSDYLVVDAALQGRTAGQQFQWLGCSALESREDQIRARVAYLASKRGISTDELWQQMVTGTYEKLTPEEWADLSAAEGKA